MFSLSKLVVLLLIIGGVWYGFKYAGRLQDRRAARAAVRADLDRRKRASRRAAPADADDDTADPAADMTLCPACKAYVPARGATNCGRPDCPF